MPSFGSAMKWLLVHRTTRPRPHDPDPSVFQRVRPAFKTPRASPSETTVTWVALSTLLLQLGVLNILTDPMWSARASPFRFAGPRRWVAPGVEFRDLPPIDVVLQSHNHYDHLDNRSVRAVARAYPQATWLVPLDRRDRKSTRLNSSHGYISYAVFCLKKKKKKYIVWKARYRRHFTSYMCSRVHVMRM